MNAAAQKSIEALNAAATMAEIALAALATFRTTKRSYEAVTRNYSAPTAMCEAVYMTLKLANQAVFAAVHVASMAFELASEMSVEPMNAENDGEYIDDLSDAHSDAEAVYDEILEMASAIEKM